MMKWSTILLPKSQKALERASGCQGHGYYFGLWGDQDLPDDFFDGVHNIACEIGTLIDGVDGVEVMQCKEKYGGTRVYANWQRTTKMKVIGNYKQLSPNNTDDPIEQPVVIYRAFELMRRRYPQYAHWIGEHGEVENPCTCKVRGYDALHLCERFSGYYTGKLNTPKESPIAWDVIRLLPRVDASTKAKALKASAKLRKDLSPFAKQLSIVKDLMNSGPDDKALDLEWAKLNEIARKKGDSL